MRRVAEVSALAARFCCDNLGFKRLIMYYLYKFISKS